MAGRRPFTEMLERMPADARARVAGRVEQTLAEMRLAELRDCLDTGRGLPQAALDVKQAAVARLAAREDVSLGTLRDYVTALGGGLEIAARFAEGAFEITEPNKNGNDC